MSGPKVKALPKTSTKQSAPPLGLSGFLVVARCRNHNGESDIPMGLFDNRPAANRCAKKVTVDTAAVKQLEAFGGDADTPDTLLDVIVIKFKGGYPVESQTRSGE